MGDGFRSLVQGARLSAVLSVTILIALCASFAACKRESSAPEQRYELQGKVVSVDRRGRTVTIAHKEIPGYMDAMAMPFKLKDEWAYDEMAAGDRVQATLVIQGERSWLEGVVFAREGADPAPVSSAAGFVEPKPGDEVPDFTLINQDRKPFHLTRYRGKALILTFIYTRCPLPDYCPLMTRRFGEILSALDGKAELAQNTQLLSITVDPSYDKPDVLRAYAAGAGVDSFDRWEFASGSDEEIKSAANYFGVQYWPEADQIVHSLRTALIGPDGKLVALYRGNDWTAEEIVSALQNLNFNNR